MTGKQRATALLPLPHRRCLSKCAEVGRGLRLHDHVCCRCMQAVYWQADMQAGRYALHLPLLNQAWLPLRSAGQFPWAGSSTAATRHYAQRYRQLQAQLDRSLEERTLLHNEVIRTFNWLEERQADISALVAAMRCEGGASGSGRGSPRGLGHGSGDANADSSSGNGGSNNTGCGGSSNAGGGSSNAGGGSSWSQLLAGGQAAQLLIQLHRIELIHDEARKLLTKYLPTRV